MREHDPDEPRGENAKRTQIDAQLREAGLDPAQVFRALSRRRLARRGALSLLAVLVVVLAIIEMPGLGALRGRFAHVDWWWIVVASALEICSVAGFVIALRSALAGRIGWRSSISIGSIAQGVNAVVPAGGTGGLVVAAVILTGAGVAGSIAVSRMIALFLITSVATNLLAIVTGGLGVASGLLTAHVTLTAALVPALLALVVILSLVYLGRRLARGNRADVARASASGEAAAGPIGRAARAVGEGVIWSGELLRAGDPLLIIGALGYVACDLAALAAAFAAVGAASPAIGALLLAYSLGQVGSVIPLPGTTEGGLVGALVLYGAPLTTAVSAVLVYRAIAILVPLLLSMIGAAQLRATVGEIRWGADGRWPIRAPETFPR